MKERVLRYYRSFLVRIANMGGLFRLLALDLYRLGMKASGEEAAFAAELRAAVEQYGPAESGRTGGKEFRTGSRRIRRSMAAEIRFCRLVYGTSPREYFLYGFGGKKQVERLSYATELGRAPFFHVLNNRILAAYLEDRTEWCRKFGCICNESLPETMPRLMIAVYRNDRNRQRILWCYLRTGGFYFQMDPETGTLTGRALAERTLSQGNAAETGPAFHSLPLWSDLCARTEALSAVLSEVRLVEWTYVYDGCEWIPESGDAAPSFTVPQCLERKGMKALLEELKQDSLKEWKETGCGHG